MNSTAWGNGVPVRHFCEMPPLIPVVKPCNSTPKVLWDATGTWKCSTTAREELFIRYNLRQPTHKHAEI